MRYLLALVLASSLAPLAGAQPPPEPSVQLTTESPAGLLQPETDSLQSSVVLEWSCSQPELTAGPSILTARFKVSEPPPFATYTMAPSEISRSSTSAEQCTDDSFRHRVDATLTVVASRKAPALEPQKVEIEARISQTPTAAGASREWGPFRTNVTYTPDYMPMFEAQPDRYTQRAEAPGIWYPFVIGVRDFSNGASRLVANVSSLRHGTSLEAQFEGGAEWVFNTSAEDAERLPHTLVLQLRIPPDEARRQGVRTVQASFTLSSLDPRGTKTDVQTLTLSLVDSKSDDLPTPGVTALTAALASAVALVRRRR